MLSKVPFGSRLFIPVLQKAFLFLSQLLLAAIRHFLCRQRSQNGAPESFSQLESNTAASSREERSFLFSFVLKVIYFVTKNNSEVYSPRKWNLFSSKGKIAQQISCVSWMHEKVAQRRVIPSVETDLFTDLRVAVCSNSILALMKKDCFYCSRVLVYSFLWTMKQQCPYFLFSFHLTENRVDAVYVSRLVPKSHQHLLQVFWNTEKRNCRSTVGEDSELNLLALGVDGRTEGLFAVQRSTALLGKLRFPPSASQSPQSSPGAPCPPRGYTLPLRVHPYPHRCTPVPSSATLYPLRVYPCTLQVHPCPLWVCYSMARYHKCCVLARTGHQELSQMYSI